MAAATSSEPQEWEIEVWGAPSVIDGSFSLLLSKLALRARLLRSCLSWLSASLCLGLFELPPTPWSLARRVGEPVACVEEDEVGLLSSSYSIASWLKDRLSTVDPGLEVVLSFVGPGGWLSAMC